MRLLAKITPLFFTFVFLWALVLAPVCLVRGLHASNEVDSHAMWESAECDRDARPHSGDHLAVEASDEDGAPTRQATLIARIAVQIGRILFPAPDEGLIRVLFERTAPETGPPRHTHGVGALPLLT